MRLAGLPCGRNCSFNLRKARGGKTPTITACSQPSNQHRRGSSAAVRGARRHVSTSSRPPSSSASPPRASRSLPGGEPHRVVGEGGAPVPRQHRPLEMLRDLFLCVTPLKPHPWAALLTAGVAVAAPPGPPNQERPRTVPPHVLQVGCPYGSPDRVAQSPEPPGSRH